MRAVSKIECDINICLYSMVGWGETTFNRKSNLKNRGDINLECIEKSTMI